ncbi:MAG TPA: hypothetical protein VFY53_02920 [Rhodoplanes sp.]|nr:hypothetical protein [Rhodoplanes sp.]
MNQNLPRRADGDAAQRELERRSWLAFGDKTAVGGVATCGTRTVETPAKSIARAREKSCSAAERVRAHVLLCMLAYHVEHHMRARLAPMLYDEADHEAAAAMRTSIVARAERSDAARRKQTTGRTDGLPVHSFKSLLADLATYSRIQATTALNEKYVFTLHTRPTPIQQRAFEILAINPDRTQ